MRLLVVLIAVASVLPMPATNAASAATIRPAAPSKRVTNAADTIYWLKADRPMVFRNGNSVGVRFVVYPNDEGVMLSSSCQGVRSLEFVGPLHGHHGMIKRLVSLTLYSSAPAPQQCSVTATISSQPSVTATLPVIVKTSF